MRVRPKPEEQPVMSHVRGRLGMVKVGLVDILVFCLLFLFFSLWQTVRCDSIRGFSLEKFEEGRCKFI